VIVPPSRREDGEMEQTADEITRLQSCINDLIGVLALPAMWSGQESAQIVSTLLDVLVGMLRLDFAYARFKDPVGEAPIEMVRLAQSRNLMARPEEIGQVLNPWLGDNPQKWPLLVPNPIGDGDVSIVPLRLGLRDEIGVIVAGSQRADFPWETERLLLSVAANQAAIGLQEARLLSEQKRVARELDQRVAQRTRELAAANEELTSEITERRRVEAKLRQDERELRGIVDVIPQLIVVREPDGTFLYANRSVLEYSGFTVDELSAPDFSTGFVHPEDWARLHDERRQGLSRSVPFEIEQRLRRKDGQYRWFVVRYHPLLDEQGRILRWYATGTDIDERKRAEQRMRNENLALREDIDRASMFEEIVGSSPALRRVLAQAAKVAKTDATVLILGETGTGKELVARAIHRRSGRSTRAFIRVNCAAIPTSLIASELFGHEKGAFTGALQRRLGRFEAADGGTIFLDEVGDLPPETQIALLRVLQEREIERVGSSQPITVDVRVLAATNRDLDAAVASGAFRQDLFFRLNVFPIRMPPLRERADDIPVLVEYLVERYARGVGKSVRHIKKHTLELLQAYEWPGNVRELQNVIERAVVLCEGETFVIDESWLQVSATQASTRMGRQVTTLAQSEKAMIEAALAEAHGRVSGPGGAAAKLGIPRQTLQSKIKALQIDKRSYQGR
jgi:formate hydrogenlyase transcriptional activator